MAEIFLRVILGLILAGAALAKLTSPRSSIAALETFGFGDEPLRPIAWSSLIGIELALAVAVALGSDAAAYAAASLMLLFAALTIGAMLRGRAGAPCACFGPRSTVSWPAVIRNLALALAFAIAPSVDSLGAQAWLGIGIGVAMIACAALTVAVLALSREVEMLRQELGPGEKVSPASPEAAHEAAPPEAAPPDAAKAEPQQSASVPGLS